MTTPSSGPDTTRTTTDGPGARRPHWVLLECQSRPDVIVGPYPDAAAAVLAMEESLLIQDLCEEDATDCYVTTEPPTAGQEHILIDLANPHHTGAA